jgi:heme A synthase
LAIAVVTVHHRAVTSQHSTKPRSFSPDQVRQLAAASTTMSVPDAAAALGMGVGGAYAAIADGTWPTRVIRCGRRLRVPSAEVLQALGLGA